MLTEDHLIRMLNLAIAALLQVIGLKKAGDTTQALALIDFTMESLVGLRTNVIKGLEDERFYYVLTRGDRLDTDRLHIIADLFKEEGDIFAEQGRTAESSDDYNRALKYYLEVFFNDDSGDKSELQAKIEALVNAQGEGTFRSDALWPLAGYWEETGAYARAEAQLIDLARRPELCESVFPELVAFYQRMLEKPDAALEAAGVRRDEVEERMRKARCGKI